MFKALFFLGLRLLTDSNRIFANEIKDEIDYRNMYLILFVSVPGATKECSKKDSLVALGSFLSWSFPSSVTHSDVTIATPQRDRWRGHRLAKRDSCHHEGVGTSGFSGGRRSFFFRESRFWWCGVFVW